MGFLGAFTGCAAWVALTDSSTALRALAGFNALLVLGAAATGGR